MQPDRSLVHPYRVAIYCAPEAPSPWWRAGSEWLGRCAWTGQALTQPVIDGISAETLHALTAEPRRYGWHATLKAPFQLASGTSLDDLRTAMRRFCQGRAAVEQAGWQVTRMGHFLALQPTPSSPALHALAADCVRQFQPLAAPLSEQTLVRRRQAGLSPAQDALLQAWGYPYVLDEFRFHFTLTGRLDHVPPDVLAALLEAAAQRFHCLPPLRVDRLSLFVEPAPGEGFRLLEQVEFAA